MVKKSPDTVKQDEWNQNLLILLVKYEKYLTLINAFYWPVLVTRYIQNIFFFLIYIDQIDILTTSRITMLHYKKFCRHDWTPTCLTFIVFFKSCHIAFFFRMHQFLNWKLKILFKICLLIFAMKCQVLKSLLLYTGPLPHICPWKPLLLLPY